MHGNATNLRVEVHFEKSSVGKNEMNQYENAKMCCPFGEMKKH